MRDLPQPSDRRDVIKLGGRTVLEVMGCRWRSTEGGDGWERELKDGRKVVRKVGGLQYSVKEWLALRVLRNPRKTVVKLILFFVIDVMLQPWVSEFCEF